MRKFLLWAAAITFTFAAFLASCATAPKADTKAPAASSQNNGNQQGNAAAGMPSLSGSSGAFHSR